MCSQLIDSVPDSAKLMRGQANATVDTGMVRSPLMSALVSTVICILLDAIS